MKNLCMVITTDVSIPLNRIADILCAGFEGGSYGIGYWAQVVDYVEPKVVTEPWRDTSHEADYKAPRYCSYPVSQGGAVLIRTTEGDDDSKYPGWSSTPHKALRLDLTAIMTGLQLLARDHASRWANFMEENEDAEDADVLIQLALLGDVVYG